MSDEIADVLAAGREYGEKYGWWRNRLIGPNGKQACALGWLLKSQGLTERDIRVRNFRYYRTRRVIRATQAIMRVVWENTDRDDCSIDELTHWNDHKAENKQQVLDVFAKAEKIERAGFDPDAP